MPVTNYYTVDGEIVGESTGSTTINYATDALGSVTGTLVGNQLRNTYTYKPYGALLAKQGTDPDPLFRWLGSWGAQATGRTGAEYYVRSNFYSSTLATYVSQASQGASLLARPWNANPISSVPVAFALPPCYAPVAIGIAAYLCQMLRHTNFWSEQVCELEGRWHPSWCKCEGYGTFKGYADGTLNITDWHATPPSYRFPVPCSLPKMSFTCKHEEIFETRACPAGFVCSDEVLAHIHSPDLFVPGTYHGWGTYMLAGIWPLGYDIKLKVFMHINYAANFYGCVKRKPLPLPLRVPSAPLDCV